MSFARCAFTILPALVLALGCSPEADPPLPPAPEARAAPASVAPPTPAAANEPAGAPQPEGLRAQGDPSRLYRAEGETGIIGADTAGYENLAYEALAPTIPEALSRHSRTMRKKVIEIVPRKVYLAVGYALANLTLIVGEDGLVFIDPPDSIEATTEAAADLLAIAATDLPIKAILYTHSHPDHFPGVKALVSQEDVDAGRVEILAHELFMKAIAEQNSTLGPVLGLRSLYSAGNTLPEGPRGRVNAGLGPLFRGGEATLIAPTRLVPEHGELKLTIAGIDMELYHTPGDIYDNVSTRFPGLGVYHYAEVMQGDNFPNLHTIRGTRYRDPERWFRSLDLIRSHTGETRFLIGSHGLPVFGNDHLQGVLVAYRDAIQFVHDQTIRQMNHGLTPDELVEVVKLPPHLANHPRLGEFYGTVDHSVREIYVGLLGFWQGDMTMMAKPGFLDRAQRYVRMMGGRDAVVAEARQAVAAGEPGWAADILTWVIRVDPEDTEARQIKADALRRWGYEVSSINWRHSALTGAQELDGTLPDTAAGSKELFGAPDIIRAMQARDTVRNMAIRLKAEDTLDVRVTGAFEFTDTGETFALEIRRGIAEFHEPAPEAADVTLVLTKALLDQALLGQTTLEAAIAAGDATVRGDPATLETFLGYFEPPVNPNDIRLTSR